VFLWFGGTALAAMWVVFRDPAIDHRLVIVGALLPDLIDAAWGAAAAGHTLVFAVVLLFVVMALTVGRRSVRRRMLAVPIGWFFHLVFDGAWSDTSLFWWPVDGFSFGDASIPAFNRPVGVTLMMELAGLVALVWVYRKFGLSDSTRRSQFARTGRIDRAITDPSS